jgi:CCR4-NOT transcription complex subunit 1
VHGEQRTAAVREALRFVEAKLARGGAGRPGTEVLAVIFKTLQLAAGPAQSELGQEVRRALDTCKAADPGLVGASAHDDIEEQANARFQQIYTGVLEMDDVVAMLQRFKDSDNERDQAIFACMIHNLFDEYRFFHNYPDKELRITGILFGNLIKVRACPRSGTFARGARGG